jgi:hypothetical protein
MAWDDTVGGAPRITSPREKMRSALCRAKSELWDARHYALEDTGEMADRIDAVYTQAERLWLDARSDAEIRRMAERAQLEAEYGPPVK